MMKNLLRVSFLISFCIFIITCKKEDIEQDKTLYYNLWVNYSQDSLIKEKLYLTSGNYCYYIRCIRVNSEFPECGKKYFYLADTVFIGAFKIFRNKLIIGENVVFKIDRTSIKADNKINLIVTSEGKIFKSINPSIFKDKELQAKIEADEIDSPCEYYFIKLFKQFKINLYRDYSHTNLFSSHIIVDSKIIKDDVFLYTEKEGNFGFKLTNIDFNTNGQEIFNSYWSNYYSYTSSGTEIKKIGKGSLAIKEFNKIKKYISGEVEFIIYKSYPSVDTVYSSQQMGQYYTKPNYIKPIESKLYAKSENFQYIFIRE